MKQTEEPKVSCSMGGLYLSKIHVVAGTRRSGKEIGDSPVLRIVWIFGAIPVHDVRISSLSGSGVHDDIILLDISTVTSLHRAFRCRALGFIIGVLRLVMIQFVAFLEIKIVVLMQ